MVECKIHEHTSYALTDPLNSNWYTNQNNFFRQIRNFHIDTTAMPVGVGAGIHWQVAQATSLQNIVFDMRTDGGEANAQQVSPLMSCF
jgi:glucan 1,3-beta-glucosidase